MQLIDDFKTKYPKYWSVWCGVASVVLSLLELLSTFGTALPVLDGVLPKGTFIAAAVFFNLCGLVARALKQSNLNPVDPSVKGSA